MKEGSKAKKTPTVRASALALIIGRLVARGAALAQVILVGRKIGPESYASFGTAVLVLSLLEIAAEQGLGTALIRKSGSIGSYLPTVWTVNVLRGLLLAIVCICLSFSSLVTGDSGGEIGLILCVLAIVPLLRGADNLASVMLSRNHEFAALVAAESVAALAGLLATILCASVGAGVWALVAGTIVTVGANTASSFVLVPKFHGLSLSWERFRELYSIGFWVAFSNWISLALTRGGAVVTLVMFSPIALSYYQYADIFATGITLEIGRLLGRLTLPLFASLNNDRESLAAAFEKALLLTAFVTCGIATAIAALSAPLVLIILGKAWMPSAELIPWIAGWGASRALGSCMSTALVAAGKPRVASSFQALMLLVFVAGVALLTPIYHATGVCMALFGAGAFVHLTRYGAVASSVGSNPYRLLRITLPFISSAILAFPVSGMVQLYLDKLWLQVLVGLSTSTLIYLVCAYLGLVLLKVDLSVLHRLKRARC